MIKQKKNRNEKKTKTTKQMLIYPSTSRHCFESIQNRKYTKCNNSLSKLNTEHFFSFLENVYIFYLACVIAPKHPYTFTPYNTQIHNLNKIAPLTY